MEKTKSQIVVMGGGGFSEEMDNPLLDDYVMSLCDRKKPRICFLPTASGDAPDYINKFYQVFPYGRAEASVLTFFRDAGIKDINSFLLNQDIIYVGGGSTANLLAIWRVHGIDLILHKAWKSGVILTGISAGMNCWFEKSLTDSFAGELSPLNDGLGLLPGSACPHYDSVEKRRPAFIECIASKKLPAGIAADDGTAIHFIGTEVYRVVSSRPASRAYRISIDGDDLHEVQLETEYLGK
ncbi:Type 1 glutamine amidotransferase-like domain-containing protein [Candidatus Riflebacteria bacterium]